MILEARKHRCAYGHTYRRRVEAPNLLLVFRSKAGNQASGHTRKERSARATFKAIAAQEFRVLCFRIKIAEAGDENSGSFAVFVDRIAPGKRVEKPRGPNSSEVVHKVTAKHSRTVSQSPRMLLRAGIEEDARRFQC